jgi:hypothetical protein
VELTGDWSKLQSEELHNFCTSYYLPFIIGMMKWTLVGECSTHVTREVSRNFWCENVREYGHKQDLSVNDRVVF